MRTRYAPFLEKEGGAMRVTSYAANTTQGKSCGMTTGIGSLFLRLLPLTVLLLFITSVPAIAQNKRIVILAPHPDDEALCCAGIVYNALQQGNSVTIVVVTNGDYGQGVPSGLAREGETVAGMAVLGLSEQN